MTKSIKSLLLSTVVAAGVMGGIAVAMPVAQLHNGSSSVEETTYPCAPGWHLNPGGDCVPYRHPGPRGMPPPPPGPWGVPPPPPD